MLSRYSTRVKNRPLRQIFCVLWVFSLVQSSIAFATESSITPSPNIIVILVDDIGVETVGAYGSEYATPNIDSIASEGVLFNNAHATPVCTTTRTRMLTGTQNFKHYKAFAHLDPDAFTVSEFIKQNGYTTLVAGKWQLSGNADDGIRGTLPEEAGFDESLVWHIEQDKKGKRYWGPTFVKNGVRTTYCDSDFGPDVLNERVLDFIDRNKDVPFFVYYPMVLAHSPWINTPDSLSAMTTKQKFDGMMAYTDKLVGKVLDKLDEHQLAENTIVWFMGDNGTHTEITSLRNGEPVQGGKWITTDAGTHVPYIVRWTGSLPEGEQRDSLVEVMDVFPTVATVIGQDIPEGLDGHDLLPIMKGSQAEVRDAIFMHYAPRWRGYRGIPMMHARFAFNKRWKLYGDGRFLDMQDDPKESTPLATSASKPVQLQAFEMLSGTMKSMNDGPLSPPYKNPKIAEVDFDEPSTCKKSGNGALPLAD